MFYVLSINTRSHKGKLVAHAKSLESAIEEVNKNARLYTLKKCDHLLHRTDSTLENAPEIRYFSKPSSTALHQVDIYRQVTRKVVGWVSITYYQEPPELVRVFMYSIYDFGNSNMPLLDPLENNSLTPITAPVSSSDHSKFHNNKLGGFPGDVLDSLTVSNQFKKQRCTADQNTEIKEKAPSSLLSALLDWSDSE